jgi:hypothetical protein
VGKRHPCRRKLYGAPGPLAALAAANAVSLLGNFVAAVAAPWFVLVTTGSAARTGVAAFFTPCRSPGALRKSRRRRGRHRVASVAGDLVGGAAIAAIPLLHAVGALHFWNLVAPSATS